MVRLKPGLIVDQTEKVVTRDRPFHEFLSEHLELASYVEYVHLPQPKEPTIGLTATAARGFLTWCLQ